MSKPSLLTKYKDALDYTTNDGTAATFYPNNMYRIWDLEETYGADVALARKEIPGFLEWLKPQISEYSWDLSLVLFETFEALEG